MTATLWKELKRVFIQWHHGNQIPLQYENRESYVEYIQRREAEKGKLADIPTLVEIYKAFFESEEI